MGGPSNPEVLARAAALFACDPGDLAPRVRDGVLDLLGGGFAPTFTQRTLDTRLTAWLYDTLRDRLTSAFGVPDFSTEARNLCERLAVGAGDAVLDVACGRGNFTVELARRVGPDGLVVGLDIAASMLARAANRVRREQLDNVVLVRGDALALPFRDRAFAHVNCSGGLHQMPDLDRALREIARATTAGGQFTGSSFARSGAEETGLRGWLWRRWSLHFVPIVALGRAVERAGFAEVGAQMAGRYMGYVWGRRAEAYSAIRPGFYKLPRAGTLGTKDTRRISLTEARPLHVFRYNHCPGVAATSGGRKKHANSTLLAPVGLVLRCCMGHRGQRADEGVTDPSLTITAVLPEFSLELPTQIRFLALKDFLVTEKDTGRDPARRRTEPCWPTEVLDLAVANDSERGLLGITLNPTLPATTGLRLLQRSSGADGGSWLKTGCPNSSGTDRRSAARRFCSGSAHRVTAWRTDPTTRRSHPFGQDGCSMESPAT